MFRNMRRTRQELTLEECELILKRCSAGVLGTAGAEGYPYAVPLSYVYLEEPATASSSMLGKLVFHCAHKGHR